MTSTDDLLNPTLDLPHTLEIRDLRFRARLRMAKDEAQVFFNEDQGVPPRTRVKERLQQTRALVETLDAVCAAPDEALPAEPIELMMVPDDGALAQRWVRIRAVGGGTIEVLPTPATTAIDKREVVYLTYLSAQVLARRLEEATGVTLPWPDYSVPDESTGTGDLSA